MATVVTRLSYQKRNNRRVNVFLNEEYAFSLADTLAAALQVGQELDEETIARLQFEDAYQRGMDKAFRLLSRRPRSRHEIDDALRQDGFPPEVRERVSQRLQELGYVDDREFARWWIENRSEFNPRSIRALRHELRQKGVPAHILDEILAGLDDESLALAAGRRRASRWRHLSRPDFERKMIGYLQRRGFGYATARAVADQLYHAD